MLKISTKPSKVAQVGFLEISYSYFNGSYCVSRAESTLFVGLALGK